VHPGVLALEGLDDTAGVDAGDRVLEGGVDVGDEHPIGAAQRPARRAASKFISICSGRWA